MITLHHLNNSRSTRIIWLLEELDLEYELVKYYRGDNKLAPDHLKKIHPLGKAPILVDDTVLDGSKAADKFTIAESGAIIEYLIHQYDTTHKLKPLVGSISWQQYLFWLHFAEGSAMPPMLIELVLKAAEKRSPRLIKPVVKGLASKVMQGFTSPNISRHNQLIEETLSSNEWFAGDKLTGADIQMSFLIEAIKARSDIEKYPHMKKWLTKVRNRPAYQTALQKGGELELG